MAWAGIGPSKSLYQPKPLWLKGTPWPEAGDAFVDHRQPRPAPSASTSHRMEVEPPQTCTQVPVVTATVFSWTVAGTPPWMTVWVAESAVLASSAAATPAAMALRMLMSRSPG